MMRFAQPSLSLTDQIQIRAWRLAIWLTRHLWRAKLTWLPVIGPAAPLLWIPLLGMISGVLFGWFLVLAWAIVLR